MRVILTHKNFAEKLNDASKFGHSTNPKKVVKMGKKKIECKKVSYRDKSSAIRAIEIIKSKDDGKKKPVRYYKCEFCNKFHLTSQE